jgi:uncharacterized protein YodC (DUF2158 family)
MELEMPQKFKIGERVQLNSGGPEMTVGKLIEGDMGDIYRCQWFAGKKLEAGNFPVESLHSLDEENGKE